MNRTILTTLLTASLAIAAGCQYFNRDKHDDKKTKANIAVSDLPVAVRQGFDRDHPGVTIVEVEKETYADGTVHYELEYKTADGKEHDVEYSATGEELDKH